MHLLNGKYKTIAKKVISVLIQMPTTCLCESVFFCLCEIKSLKTNLVTHIDPLIRVAILKWISFLNLECWLIICNTKKVIKDNFLNLLCALPYVILNAGWSAIVFLRIIFNVAFCLTSNLKHRVHDLVSGFFRAHHIEKGWKTLL